MPRENDRARRRARGRQRESKQVAAMLSDDYRSLLEPPDMLARLTPEERQLVSCRAVPIAVPAGRTLFVQDDAHHGIFLITDGLVRVFYVSQSGREITLGYWSRGHFAGGPEVFGRGTHVWSGEAVSRTRALFLAGPDVEALVTRIPSFALGIIEGLIYKGRCYSALCRILGTRSVVDRLTILFRLLGELHGENHPEGVRLTRRFTHEDLSRLIGATRQWVTTAIRRLEDEQLIDRQGDALVLRRALTG